MSPNSLNNQPKPTKPKDPSSPEATKAAEEQLWDALARRPQPPAPPQLKNQILKAISQAEQEQQAKQGNFPWLGWLQQSPKLACACALLLPGILAASLMLNSPTKQDEPKLVSHPSPAADLSEEDLRWLLGDTAPETPTTSSAKPLLPSDSTEAQLLAWESYLEVNLLSAYTEQSQWPAVELLAYEELF